MEHISGGAGVAVPRGLQGFLPGQGSTAVCGVGLFGGGRG